MQILIGTNNQNKLKQFRFLFSKYLPEIEVLSLADLDITDDVEEDAESLLENARKKAEFYAKKSGLPTIADDTGLFVDALGGEPGVHAKRWHEGTENDRCLKLIDRLKDVPEKDRTCRYKGVLAYFNPSNGRNWSYESNCEGLITDYFKGDNGFGYDQIFKFIEFDKQYAELTEEEKLIVGHRGKGIKMFVQVLTKIDI